MGIINAIGGPLLALTRTALLKFVPPFIDQAMGRGPNALGPLTKEVDKLIGGGLPIVRDHQDSGRAANASDGIHLGQGNCLLDELQAA